MKKSKKLIIGNWKMNPPSLEEAKKIALGTKRAMSKLRKTSVVLCPPYVYLSALATVPKGALYLGAQNANHEVSGSFTGEVSFSQLSQFKTRFVIVGHSERRKMGEGNDLINKKVKSTLSVGLTAVLCVGEGVRDNNGDYFHFIKEQIISAINDVPKKLLANLVVAYEPIWAIGATSAMSPTDLHEMSIFIKKVLKDFGGDFAENVPVLYGGSVDTTNAESLIKDGNVSGLLIGRQSLVLKDFLEIIKIVDKI